MGQMPSTKPVTQVIGSILVTSDGIVEGPYFDIVSALESDHAKIDEGASLLLAGSNFSLS